MHSAVGRSRREGTGGQQLLKELEALSQVLHNAGQHSDTSRRMEPRSGLRSEDAQSPSYFRSRREAPPSPDLETIKHEQFVVPARSPFLSSRQKPPSPHLGGRKSPSSFLQRSRGGEKSASLYLGARRDVLNSPFLDARREEPSSPNRGARRNTLEPPSPQLGALTREDPQSPYPGVRRDEEPLSPYLGVRRDIQEPSSSYFAARRDHEPSSPYFGARREEPSSPYLESGRGEQRHFPFGCNAIIEPEWPFLGTIEESRAPPTSPYLDRNVNMLLSYIPGKEARSPRMGRRERMPPRSVSESFPRTGCLTPQALSSAADARRLPQTQRLSIDTTFCGTPHESLSASGNRSESYRLDARRAASLSPQQGEGKQGHALQPWYSQGFEKNLLEMGNFPTWLKDNVQFSQKLEAPKEKNGFRYWKPFRAIARIAQQRFNCVFTLQVHGIDGLPAAMNGHRLSISWRHKETLAQTVPSRVFQGSAEFEETLNVKSTIYGSKSGSSGIKYEPKNFDLAVIALDVNSIVLGKHRLDLTHLLPANPDKLDNKKLSTWMTSFKLSGKAQGANLVVTFGYQLLGKDSQLLSNLSNARYVDSPIMKPSRWDYNSLPNSPQRLLLHAGQALDANYSPAMSEPPHQYNEYMGMEHLNLDEYTALEKPYVLGGHALRGYAQPELQGFREPEPSFLHRTNPVWTPPSQWSAEEHVKTCKESSVQEIQLRNAELTEDEADFMVVELQPEPVTWSKNASSQEFGYIQDHDLVQIDEEQAEGGIVQVEEEEQITEDPAEIDPEISQETSLKADPLTGEECSHTGDMKVSADMSQKLESGEEPHMEEQDVCDNTPPKQQFQQGLESGAGDLTLEIDYEEEKNGEIPGHHDEMKDFVDDMDAWNEQWIEGDEGKSARLFIEETENDETDDISPHWFIKSPFSFLQEATVTYKRDTAHIDKEGSENPIHSKVEETATKNVIHPSLEEAEYQNANEEVKRSISLNADDEIDLVAGEFLNLLENERGATDVSSGVEADSPRAQLLKQFEQEALIEGGISLGFNLLDSFDDNHARLQCEIKLKWSALENHGHSLYNPSHFHNLSTSGWNSEEDLELASIMEGAEFELQKAIQLIHSRSLNAR